MALRRVLAGGLLLVAWDARAGLIDEFAARDDWACSYGTKETTCGGPDEWVGIPAAHTVRICGAGEEADVCGHTWRVNGDRDALFNALMTWSERLQNRFKSQAWVLAPARAPDDWMAVIRGTSHQAELEVGRGHVQVRISENPPCAMKAASLALDGPIRDLLPDVEEGEPVSQLLALAWDQLGDLTFGGIDAEKVPGILDRPARAAYDKLLLARWNLVSSEPFRCVMVQEKQTDPVAAVPVVIDAWRRATAPTPEEKRAMKAREKEEARIAKKHGDVDAGDDSLSDDASAPAGSGANADGSGAEIDIDDLLGDDDPAGDP